MLHRMNLWEGPFLAIQSGTKDVELRLHDEKRQAIRVGDTIEFTNAKTGQCLQVRVVGKAVFRDFAELYAHYDKIRMGYTADEIPDPEDMRRYYSPADMEKYGTVAIEIALLRK